LLDREARDQHVAAEEEGEVGELLHREGLPIPELRCYGWLNAAAYERLSGNWCEAVAGCKAALAEAAGDEALLVVAWREYLLLLAQLAATAAADAALLAPNRNSSSNGREGVAGGSPGTAAAAQSLAVAEQSLVGAVLQAVACFVQLQSQAGGRVPALQLPVLTYPSQPEVEGRWHPAAVEVHGWLEEVLGELLMTTLLPRRQVRGGGRMGEGGGGFAFGLEVRVAGRHADMRCKLLSMILPVCL
jgi:hypothetical protein